MYEKDKITVNGTEINISYEIKMAISKILYWETKKIKNYMELPRSWKYNYCN